MTREPENTSGWAASAHIGYEFIAAVGLLGGAGYGLDVWLGTGPWLLIVGIGLGFAVGLTLMIRGAKGTFKN